MAGDFKPANEKKHKLKWVSKLEVMKTPKIFTPKFHHQGAIFWWRKELFWPYGLG